MAKKTTNVKDNFNRGDYFTSTKETTSVGTPNTSSKNAQAKLLNMMRNTKK